MRPSSLPIPAVVNQIADRHVFNTGAVGIKESGCRAVYRNQGWSCPRIAIRFEGLIQDGDVTDYAELSRLAHVYNTGH